MSPQRGIIGGGAGLALLAACAGLSEKVAGATECVVPTAAQSSVRFARRTPPNPAAIALARAHNEGVRSIFRLGGRAHPRPQTIGEVAAAAIDGARAYAMEIGEHPDTLALAMKVALVAGAGDRLDNPSVRALVSTLLADPSVRSGVRSWKAGEARILANRFQHAHPREASVSEMMSDSMRYEAGAGDMLAAITDSSVEAPQAVYNTDEAADYWSGEITDTIYRNAVFGIQEVSDSSRYFWEASALQAWIDADGDTTIFNPQYSIGGNARCAPGTEVFGGKDPAVMACPQCVAAGIWGAGSDIVAAYINYGNHVAHPVGSVVVASTGAAIMGWATTGSVLVGITGRVTGWLTRLFG